MEGGVAGSNVLHVPLEGKLWSSKGVAKSSPGVPRNPRIHVRSYQTTSGAREGKGGVGRHQRSQRSNVESSQGNSEMKKLDRVDYPDKKCIIHGWFDDAHRNISHSCNKRCREKRKGRYRTRSRGSNIE